MKKKDFLSHKLPPKKAYFRFYEELNDFLPAKNRKNEFEVQFFGTPAIKDVIESRGVPHAEIDLILVNGNSVNFEYRLSSGDRISVYPVFESIDIFPVTRLRPGPLREPKFICDVHLGKLARRLRLMGFDTLYKNDYEDIDIAIISRNESRVVLTRDIGLLKIGIVSRGYWLRSSCPEKQLHEVLERFQLCSLVKPFSRCTECNGNVVEVKKEDIVKRIYDKTARFYDKFYQCIGCKKVYWRGPHYRRLKALVDEIRGECRR